MGIVDLLLRNMRSRIDFKKGQNFGQSPNRGR
jgi:hypothetical protein